MLSRAPHLRRCCGVLPNCWRRHHPSHPVLVRTISDGVVTGVVTKGGVVTEVVTTGCTKLPDLTLFWPFHVWPSDVAAAFLDQIQQGSQLPWWGAVLVGAAALKLPLFGFNIYNLRKIQQFFVTSPHQVTHFVLTYFNNLVTKGEAHALKMANNERRFTLLRGMSWDYHMKPRMFSHISYVPIYWLIGCHVSMLGGLHWLNRIQYVPLLSGGLPWCTNLTLADPYMFLPALCVGTALLNLYLHPFHRLFPLPQLTLPHLLLLSPFLAVLGSLVSSLPADVTLYMISCNLAACLLNTAILRYPAVYQEFGLVSSGEVLNRVIPPATVFRELNKTLQRQNYLLEQREQQAALAEQRKTDIALKSGQETLNIEDGLNKKRSTLPNTEVQEEVNVPDIKTSFVRKNTDAGDLLPHLNVKKVFIQD